MTRILERLMGVLLIAALVGTAASCGGVTDAPEVSRGIFGMELAPQLMKNYPDAFARMGELGVDWVRIGVGWAKLEPEPGRFEWSSIDGMVASARGQGMSIMVTIMGLSLWGSKRVPANVGKQGGYLASSPPKDINQYAAFVEALVGRYRGQGIAWQIENEPNGPAFWDGTREEYIEVLEAGYRAAHRADPEAVVLAAGLACTFSRPEVLAEKMEAIRSWYDAIMDSGAFDALDAHDYYPPEEGNPLGLTFRDYIREIKGWMEARGVDVPLWMSEAGVSSTPADFGWIKVPFTPERQAGDLRLMYEEAAAEGVAHVFWYQLVDTPDEGLFSHMGVLAPDLAPKPAWETYHQMASQ